MIIQIFTFQESCLRVCQSCYDKNKEKILSWTKGNYAQCIDCCTQEWVVHCKVDVTIENTTPVFCTLTTTGNQTLISCTCTLTAFENTGTISHM